MTTKKELKEEIAKLKALPKNLDPIPKEMFCKKTRKIEKQKLVKSNEDGFFLKCLGCGKVRGYEIGRFVE